MERLRFAENVRWGLSFYVALLVKVETVVLAPGTEYDLRVRYSLRIGGREH